MLYRDHVLQCNLNLKNFSAQYSLKKPANSQCCVKSTLHIVFRYIRMPDAYIRFCTTISYLVEFAFCSLTLAGETLLSGFVPSYLMVPFPFADWSQLWNSLPPDLSNPNHSLISFFKQLNIQVLPFWICTLAQYKNMNNDLNKNNEASHNNEASYNIMTHVTTRFQRTGVTPSHPPQPREGNSQTDLSRISQQQCPLVPPQSVVNLRRHL